MRLARAGPNRRLHVALTHGMAPFEQIGEPNGNAYRLLYGALCEAAGEPKCCEREIVKAYRASWMSQGYRPDITNLIDELKTGKRYPNSAELLRAVIGTNRLSGGITERDKAKHKELVAAWTDSGIVVAARVALGRSPGGIDQTSVPPVAIRRKPWSQSIGIGGRNQSETVVGISRNAHPGSRRDVDWAVGGLCGRNSRLCGDDPAALMAAHGMGRR